MDITYGNVQDGIPDGFIARVHFPTLNRLNERTGDGRLIHGSGFGSRELPLSIRMQEVVSYGHEGAVLVGRLDKIKVAGNNTEGWGFLLNDANGQKTLRYLRTKALRGNSIDLADVEVEVDIDWDTMELLVDFTKSRIAATTIVMTPAFAEASAEVDEASELQAAMEWAAGQDFVEVTFDSIAINVPELGDLTASTGIVQPHEAFTMPEADHHTTLTVDENGRVYGHLGTWNSCHTGWVDRCVRIPHSPTNYANFCKSRVLTTEGFVFTGPIFLMDGHKATAEAIRDGVNDTQNAWADVTVIDGEIGPWVSGVVRPGVPDEHVYTARASRISGHWINEGRGLDLFAIASVNAEGFNVPRFSFTTNTTNEVDYLAASFEVSCGCEDAEPTIEERVAALEAKLSVPDLDPDYIAAVAINAVAVLELDDDE